MNMPIKAPNKKPIYTRWYFWLFAFLIFCVIVSNIFPKTPEEENGKSENNNSISTEIKSQYNFYEKSIKEIKSKMKINDEQTNEIFLALVAVGVDEETRVRKSYSSDNTYEITWSGSYDSCNVIIIDDDFEIKNGDNILYPLDRATATINKSAVDEVVVMIDNLNEDSTYADYELIKSAYDFLTKKLKDKISKDQTNKLNSFPDRFYTIEQAVDVAIEKARVEIEDVIIRKDILSEDENAVFILIYIKGQNSLTVGWTRAGMFKQASDILEYLQVRQEISSIALFWSLTFVDSYGNTYESNAMKLELERATLQKINFENFDRENYPIIADFYYEHSALTK